MPEITVHQLDVMTAAVWDFRTSAPSWRWRRHGHMATFDPFPGYSHDTATAQAAAEHVQACCPPLWDIQVHLADREEVGRSNGYSYLDESGHYEGDTWVQDPPVGLVMLSGKRVPPHPAMTRYLVGHEYGHHIEYMLVKNRGAKHAADDTVVREYADLRGLPEESVHHGSGGRWHDSVTEVFACDFRIIVCDVERDYWPHPGIPHPDELDLSGWWDKALAELDAARAKEGA